MSTVFAGIAMILALAAPLSGWVLVRLASNRSAWWWLPFVLYPPFSLLAWNVLELNNWDQWVSNDRRMRGSLSQVTITSRVPGIEDVKGLQQPYVEVTYIDSSIPGGVGRRRLLLHIAPDHLRETGLVRLGLLLTGVAWTSWLLWPRQQRNRSRPASPAT